MDRHDAGSIFYLSRKRMAEKGLLHHERAGEENEYREKLEKEKKRQEILKKSKMSCRAEK